MVVRVAVVSFIGIPYLTFEYLSVNTRMKRLSDLFLGSYPRISSATNLNGLFSREEAKIFLRFLEGFVRFREIFSISYVI